MTTIEKVERLKKRYIKDYNRKGLDRDDQLGYEYAIQAIDDVLSVLGEKHMHVASEQGDICRVCERDLRDSSHLRLNNKH